MGRESVLTRHVEIAVLLVVAHGLANTRLRPARCAIGKTTARVTLNPWLRLGTPLLATVVFAQHVGALSHLKHVSS